MRASRSAREAVLHEVVALVRANSGDDDAGPARIDNAENLVERYFATMATEDLVQRSPADLDGALRTHWHLARSRPAGVANVAVFAPDVSRHGWTSSHSVVQVVTDDMPFLVDSVANAVRRQGCAVEQVIHPTSSVARDEAGQLVGSIGSAPADAPVESFLHVEFDRETDPEILQRIDREVRAALADVRVAVNDWRALQGRAREIGAKLRAEANRLAASELADAALSAGDREEEAALFEWIADDHFTLLGAIDVSFHGGASSSDEASALGILRGDREGTARDVFVAPSTIQAKVPLLVTKTESDSTIHRAAPLDLVVVQQVGSDGVVVGARCLVGLFTSDAYLSSPTEIPLLRRKVAEIVARSGLNPKGHAGKELKTILESHPRDELFAATTDELEATALAVLALAERRRVLLLARHDANRRAWSCLVYLPRDRYTTEVRRRIQDILLSALGGVSCAYTTTLSDSALARLHFTVKVHDGVAATEGSTLDLEVVEQQIAAAVRSWTDDLRASLSSHVGEELGRDLQARYGAAFPGSYSADVSGRMAVVDVLAFEKMRATEAMVIELRRSVDAPSGSARLKLYVPGAPLVLSDVLPVLTNLGAQVHDERPCAVKIDGKAAHLYDLGISANSSLEDPDAQDRLAEAFAATWLGQNTDDGFNRLVLAAGLRWTEVRVLRAYARYLRQLGFTYSQGYIEAAFLEQPAITKSLVELFAVRFDPDRVEENLSAVEARANELLVMIHQALEAVPSLDQDRILRAYVTLIGATLRTNCYQHGADGQQRPTLAFKLDPSSIPDAPLPRPKFEIFVSSPRVEGVHLRMGSVARGGLRWSERPEDFRTEVLGLMKAQAVKNAVIVPAGAKGGFIVRRPPAERSALMDEVVACYQLFVGSLLDLTDNRVADQVVAPERTVRYDGDDPYLVVAADKGTATFSDIANDIAVSRGFWLGDAFASGGSQGYDHKAMAITARGAWESVRQHFRRIGQNPETDPITAVGIGDMSGDVFGNGMLLSRSMRLVAAFDHRHIFLDPNPDAHASFGERQRLFAQPRSSWADYDTSLISMGGGVHARSAKAIDISEPVRCALDLGPEVASMTPTALISAILRAQVDLLWNGGIGTYVKASTETHQAAGDRANDVLRIDATELRAKVVGEGGNLGFTQLGRIEFARRGGFINTDAIDNSAGVDTSDHEVNLKILLDQVVRDGELTTKHRNEVLARMTDDVAAHVLRDNIDQNRLLVNSLAGASSMLELHARYIGHLEEVARLDRDLEGLPSESAIAARRAAGEGLTAPELAVLVAYTKLYLQDQLLASGAEDPAFETVLREYFPGEASQSFGPWIDKHPLHKEIVAVGAVNQMVNRNGVTFAFRMAEETQAAPADIIRAHMAASNILRADDFWNAVCALDNVATTTTQTELFLECDRAVERVTRWLLRNRRTPVSVQGAIDEFAASLATIDDGFEHTLSGGEAHNAAERRARWVELGVPVELATTASHLDVVPAAMDMVELSKREGLTGTQINDVSALWFSVDQALDLSSLRERIGALPRDDRWQSLARAALRDDLVGEHTALVGSVLASTAFADEPAVRVARWVEARSAVIDRYLTLAGDAQSERAQLVPLAPLSVVLRELRSLARIR